MKMLLLSLLFLIGCATYERYPYCEEYTYNGHTYLQFYTKEGMSAVHDPDCKHPSHQKKVTTFTKKYIKGI